MAITSVNIRKDGRSSNHTAEGRNYTVTYIVKSDSASDDEDLVYAHASIPDIGDAYAADATVSCTSVQVDAVAGTNNTWVVTVQYTGNQKVKTDYNWTYTPIREVMERDVNGDLVANSADVPFSPGIERDVYVPTCKVTRSEQLVSLGGTYDPALLATLVGGTNDLAIVVDGYSALIGECLLKDVQAVDPPDIQGNGAYFTVTYTLMFKKNDPFGAWPPANSTFNAWYRVLVDAGLMYEQNGVLQTARADSGDEVKTPILLDGVGGKNISASVYYRAFEVHEPVNLNQLNL